MDRLWQIVAYVLEIPLVGVLVFCIGMGYCDDKLAGLPFAATLTALVLSVLLFCMVFFPVIARMCFQSVHGALWVSIILLASVHAVTPTLLRDPGTYAFIYHQTPLFFLYYCAIVLFAISSTKKLWTALLGIIVVTEILSMVLHGYFNPVIRIASDSSLAAIKTLFSLLAPLLPFIGSAAFIGLLAEYAALWRSAAAVHDQKQVAGKPESTLMRKSDTANVDTIMNLTRTAQFTLDYNSGAQKLDANSMNDLLSSVVYFMSRNFKAFSALGFIYDPLQKAFVLNSFHSKSMNINRGVAIPLGKGIIGTIGTEARSFISGDLSNYNQEVLYYTVRQQVNSIVAVPIISEAKELFGVLCIDSPDKNAFSEQHKETLYRFSSFAAALIANVRMRYIQEQTARHFEWFYEISRSFTTTVSLTQVYDVLLNTVMKFTNATRAIIVLFDADQKNGQVYRILGASPEVKEGFTFGVNTGLYSYALQNKQTIAVPDFAAYEGKYYRFVPEEPKNQAIRSLTIIPILDSESRCLGLLSVESDVPDLFSGNMDQLLSTLTGNASVAIVRAVLYEKMQTLATTDGLTQLNNHRHFQSLLCTEIERSRRYNRPMSLLLLDIDHFKKFNDTYGHPVGDMVLRKVAECIRSAIRTNDMPARYGGEEFTVILPESDSTGAMITAERIRKTIEDQNIELDGKILKITVSIGASFFPLHTTVQQELIDKADKALYFSKERGRNRCTLFAEGM